LIAEQLNSKSENFFLLFLELLSVLLVMKLDFGSEQRIGSPEAGLINMGWVFCQPFYLLAVKIAHLK
jgi:hypothetical protein